MHNITVRLSPDILLILAGAAVMAVACSKRKTCETIANRSILFRVFFFLVSSLDSVAIVRLCLCTPIRGRVREAIYMLFA